MMRKVLYLLCTLLLLVSCAPNTKKDDVIQTDDETAEKELSVIPSHQLSEDNYKILLPYNPSEARGVITNQLKNRVDIDEVETGLRRHSVDVFDPEKYYFEEGQYLTTEMTYDLIDQLNPKIKEDSSEKDHRKNPRHLSHILEQNFLKRNEDNTVQLEGVSIGIALKSVYGFQTETGGPSYYEDISKQETLDKGKEIAEEVLKKVRKIEGLENKKIMIALYREQEQASPIPGNYIAKTVVDKGDKKIGKWEEIDEEYVLFPSDRAKDKYFEDYQKVKSFSDDVAKYFPNYVGVVGKGFYVRKELNKLSLEIPMEFYGKGEVVGFTQYTYGLVKEIFPKHYDIEVIITSSDKMESLITRKAGSDELEVHIFD